MTDEAAQRASGKIELAMQRLADRFPFFAGILERFRVFVRPDVVTMGVAAAEDAILLMHSPAFVLATPLDQLVSVLMHEVLHVLLGHVTADPDEFPDDWARTIAEEVTVNEFIVGPLPGAPIRLKDFPDLPPMESTKERYVRLQRVKDRFEIEGPRFERPTEGGKEPNGPEFDSALGTERGEHDGPTSTLVDDHRAWPLAEDREDTQQLIRQVVDEAAMEVGRDELPEELHAVLGELGVGNHRGAEHRALAGSRGAHLDWRQLLRRYAGQVLQPRATFDRPPRRFPDLVGIVPGRCRHPMKPRVMAIIDTSASMTDEMLENINKELAAMARVHRVIVCECDADIQDVYEYRPLTCVTGGGGTDFGPPLQVEFLRKHRPDLIVFFTDGYGEVPDDPPPMPIIWCLMPHGQGPADWGRVIRMAGDDAGMLDGNRPDLY